MTTQNIFPALRYRDADRALAWLREAFGFTEKAVHRGEDGAIQHAELELDGGLIMLGQAAVPPEPDGRCSIYVTVTDPDGHCARAQAAGAQITRQLADQPYGSREYGVNDLEGNAWSFGTYDPHTA